MLHAWLGKQEETRGIRRQTDMATILPVYFNRNFLMECMHVMNPSQRRSFDVAQPGPQLDSLPAEAMLSAMRSLKVMTALR